MKIALASAPFQNGKTKENIINMQSFISAAKEQGAQCILFGETALQGFDAFTWEIEKDREIAIELDGSVIQHFCRMAKESGICISFGYLEKEDSCLYSSQVVIGTDGKVLANFRRVSAGWKVPSCTHPDYREGEGFFVFDLLGKRTAIALCGDFWYDERVEEMKLLQPELVLWPVYCDYAPDEWNKTVKYKYLEQTSKISAPVLLVNPYCNDAGDHEVSKGCCVHFEQGKIITELPSGSPGIVVTEV